MAAPRALQQYRGFPRLLGSSHRYSSATPSGPLKNAILQYLCDRFYDIEYLVAWSIRHEDDKIIKKNTYHGNIKEVYGENIAAADFALSNRGGVRFQGQEKWLRPDVRGKYSKDFLELRDLPVEAIDLSGSILNYNGLDNLVLLKGLKSLNLSCCPNIDDWSLSRLHVFKDSLEELSLAGCPQVTERGLACLHQLECLRRLDVSYLPSVSNKGLIRILVEEMLPQCEIVGLDYGDMPVLDAGVQPSRDGTTEPGVPSGDRKAGEISA
ncbi:distal membrane-arm assembly complex protein 2 [Emydura macquarii macquarii]|uniref:distal membrane-arm assembly complex protein 2 n=1 Tax=Emydura macquarii macquarii TaxID=1129001 RepID=UPI00352A669F